MDSTNLNFSPTKTDNDIYTVYIYICFCIISGCHPLWHIVTLTLYLSMDPDRSTSTGERVIRFINPSFVDHEVLIAQFDGIVPRRVSGHLIILALECIVIKNPKVFFDVETVEQRTRKEHCDCVKLISLID